MLNKCRSSSVHIMSNKLVLILQYTAFLRNIWEDWTRKIECMCKRQTKDVRKHIKWASTAVFPAVVLGFHLISVLYHQDNAEQFDFKVLFSHLRPKVLSCLNIPTPAAFFQPLYNLHNGNFKVRCSTDFLCSSVKGGGWFVSGTNCSTSWAVLPTHGFGLPGSPWFPSFLSPNTNYTIRTASASVEIKSLQ